MNRIAALISLLVAVTATLVACASSSSAGQASSVSTLQPITHVVLVMEENHSLSQTYGSAMPYLTGLANSYGVEKDEHSIGLPSLPNYIALTSGNTQKAGGGSFIGTDCQPSASCQSSSTSIFGQQGGSGWRVLAESMPSNCDHANSGEYAVRHTAAPYYTGIATSCKTQDVPYSESAAPNIAARFTLVAPNLLHDAHDGTLAQADAWLKTVIPKMTSQARFQNGSTLIEVTFDSGGPNNTVETVLVNPRLSGKVVTVAATHYSLLRLNDELLGKTPLGQAASAPDIRSAFGL